MIVRIVIAIAVIAAIVAVPAWNRDPESTLQGWVEADLVFVSPDENGRVETLAAREGDSVKKGAPLFTLDDELQRADLVVAEASVENARATFERAKQLLKNSAGTQKAYDDAEAALRSAEARCNAAQTRLARRRAASPADGVVQQVYFRPGEMVTAGRPVVALLPPGNIKVRFFVPEATLPTIAIGDAVALRCDGCPVGLQAHVSFISRTAEFTPPVIYSQEERAKLVFMVEARPEKPEQLRVGQPLSVLLAANGARP
ncbi:MAG: efflux RND transporter periplasmic adaptor subunit [Rhizobiales bacterium]|nr:efflux RND transporter periplasmic adaptor subunit [Hyphomicrobiales bacterium]